ncbi:MAG: hypothetical protein CMF61_01780 [Magnetococcales bacterium]|nr:hypothetical protein [Magnetococcales bacterium]|tara:strand:- start:1878 stop:2729 length:852 start_codon:yes stop_codon:yes gene_type:complete
MAKKQKKSSKNTQTKKPGFLSWLRGCFLTGLLVVLPIIITFYIIKFTVSVVNNVAESFFPPRFAPSNFLPYDIPGVELFMGVLALVFIGISVRNFVGAKLVKWAENIVTSIPGVRSIYGAVKQVIDTVSVSNSSSFREVVMVEYPRPGLWAIAFVTGETKGEVGRSQKCDLVNVFLPTTPNPTSGFLLFVPRSELKPLHMTVEQGVKMVISAGIITPTTAEGYDALQKEQKKQDRENVIVPKVTSKDVKEAKAITAQRIASEKAAEKKIKAKTAKKPSKASKK